MLNVFLPWRWPADPPTGCHSASVCAAFVCQVYVVKSQALSVCVCVCASMCIWSQISSLSVFFSTLRGVQGRSCLSCFLDPNQSVSFMFSRRLPLSSKSTSESSLHVRSINTERNKAPPLCLTHPSAHPPPALTACWSVNQMLPQSPGTASSFRTLVVCHKKVWCLIKKKKKYRSSGGTFRDAAGAFLLIFLLFWRPAVFSVMRQDGRSAAVWRFAVPFVFDLLNINHCSATS